MLDKVESYLYPVLEYLYKKGFNPILSPIVYDKSEAAKLRLLYLDLVYDARVLYDPQNFFHEILERMKRKMKEYGSKRKYIGKKWYW